MEKILSKLDEAVFTDELKKEISDSFNEAVDVKVEILAAEKALTLIEEKEEELNDDFEFKMSNYKDRLLENLDEFLNLIVDEYIEENKIIIEESVQGEKLEALLEGFNALIIAGGIEIKQIAENLDDTENKNLIEENAKKIDTLTVENIDLKKQKAELLKMGLVAEIKEGMSVLQKEKFDKLASLIEFDDMNASRYLTKLETLKESVMGGKIDKNINISSDYMYIEENVENLEGSKLLSEVSDSSRFF